jgi:hypothetical protein
MRKENIAFSAEKSILDQQKKSQPGSKSRFWQFFYYDTDRQYGKNRMSFWEKTFV